MMAADASKSSLAPSLSRQGKMSPKRPFLLFVVAIAIVTVLFAISYLPKNHDLLGLTNGNQLTKQPSYLQWWSHLPLPITPTLKTDNKDAAKAIEDVFRYTNAGGWIDVNALKFEDVDVLRKLGRLIMSRETNCGKPTVLKEVIALELEYCFWKEDFVSDRAIDNFGFEPELWGWVVREFRGLNKELERYQLNATGCDLAFLDAGVNVGDWASPLRLALPTVPYFGIEGTPSTGAIATANLLTSIEHHRRSSSPVAPTALLPFSLVSKSMIESVQEAGGVCFGQDAGNVGGQGVSAVGSLSCLPAVTAGGTLLPHALQALIPFQSCPGKQNWPRIYIAKFDIQGFEFKALVSALDWLVERTPCYLMIEMQQVAQNTAIMELLLDLGYDSVWRTHNSYPHNDTFQHEEFPPGPPYWSRQQNTSKTLHQAVDEDMKTLTMFWYYKDYIFGFENKEKCLRRLLQ